MKDFDNSVEKNKDLLKRLAEETKDMPMMAWDETLKSWITDPPWGRPGQGAKE